MVVINCIKYQTMKQSCVIVDNKDKFLVNCSWNVADKDIKDAFVMEEFNSGGDCGDPSEFIMLESCILLTKPDNSEETLTVDVKLTDCEKALRKISIVSEANLIEVYGLFGEYLTTVKGNVVEDVDGTIVYSSNIDLNSSLLQETSLKFVGLKDIKQVWLFGVRLFIVDEKKSTGVDLSRIENRLASTHLTENAEKFKRMVTDYAKRRGGENSASFAQSSFVPEAAHISTGNKSENQIPASIKSYIDSSLREMENRIMDRVAQRLHEIELKQNARLDLL